MMKAKDLKQDKHNYRKHSDRNKQIIKRSIDECGFGRSVVIDADGVLIAGNGVSSVVDKDTPVRVVETDGSELVVVKRTDLHEGDVRRKKLAMADNAAADNVEWNMDNLLQDFSQDEFADWGIEIGGGIKETERLSALEFTDMYYTPKNNPQIQLKDCFDLTKFRAKVDAINHLDLTDEQKEVLRVFAYRFIKIDFESVANYYAFNANDEEKKAIERLRLVLVDGAIDGFVSDDMLKVNEIMLDNEDEQE